MTRTVQVQVTTEDIAKGEPLRPCVCPIARAVRRAVPESDYVGVTRNQIRVRLGLRIHYFDMPLEAVNFIAAFDARMPVEPFAFPLTIIAPEAA